MVVVVPAVAGVHADIEAGPGEDRDGGEHRSRSVTRREIGGERAGREAEEGNGREKKLFHFEWVHS